MKPNVHLDRLQTIFREIFEDNTLQIEEGTTRSEISGWDSIETVRILVAIEEAYDLRLTMTEVANLKSVGDFLALIPKAQPARQTQAIEQTTETLTSIPIAIAGTSTTAFISKELENTAQLNGLSLDLYAVPFGSMYQQILDPDSELYRRSPRFVFLHVHWRDLKLSPITKNAEEKVTSIVNEWLELWKTIRSHCGATILQFAFDLPTTISEGQLSWLHNGGRWKIIHEINLALSKADPDGVVFLPSPQFLATHWSDERAWISQRQHPAHSALKQTCVQLVHGIRASLGMNRKILVLDLDNTLWGGIVGEVGVDGIELGPTSPAGEAYQNFQVFAKELTKRGVLLAVSSKNEESRARAVFKNHNSMVLELTDFVEFQANWNRKSDSILHISKAIGLGLDSFVFVDDSPSECEEVKLTLPEVHTICIQGDPAEITQKVMDSGAFEALAISQEDQSRTTFYTQEKLRQQHEQRFTSYESYLRGLDMKLTVARIDEDSCKRAAQLINKTNQFNLSLKRRTDAELREFLKVEGNVGRIFSLSDKFGDYGWIAVTLAQAKQNTWSLDTLLMSCRVFARGVENVMLDTVFSDAKTAGANTVTAAYRPTDRNELVQKYLIDSNFKEGTNESGVIQYSQLVTDYASSMTCFKDILTASEPQL